jgi:phospholipid/cholesterol/gamma-HCH transport system substrate-binding protein
MTRAIRKHLRDFIAILFLIHVAAGTAGYILSNQRFYLPAWVPVLGTDFFELKGQFSTAQSVTPGQGQTIQIAGVSVGEIDKVELVDGRAIVTMSVRQKYKDLVKRDATMLLRPKTGLKDMFLELDPGTDSDPSSDQDEYEDGDMIPVANTAPDVNVDQILEALDADTRSYLRLLLVGGGQGLDGRGKDLGELLGSLGPINRGLARLNSEVATRKENLARLIHNMNLLWGRVGQDGEGIEQLLVASNQALGAIASQSPDVRRTVELLGPTLSTTRSALERTGELAEVLGPAVNSLRPFARKLKPVNDSLGNLARRTIGPVKEDIRPFVRNAREPVRNLRPAAQNLVRAMPRLTTVGNKLNKLFNMAAYNPNGAELPGTPNRDEGYLYWLGWLAHVGNSTFSSQDAHGVYRHVFLLLTCETANAIGLSSPLADLSTGLSFNGLFDSGVCPP